MRNQIKYSLLSSSAFALMAATSAYAQTAPSEGVDDVVTMDVVITTGTHITGARVNEALPVTVITAEELQSIGTLDGEDLIRSLPSNGAVNFNGSNNVSPNNARGDIASINLRSIGSSGTLVLLNGRRVVNHPGTQAELSTPVTTVNTNALPVGGVRRMEVLNDGASAIYGSDAVAGVVNMILKDNYEGLSASARTGFATNTDMREHSLTVTGGKDFEDGKTNISFFAEYSNRNGQMAKELDYTSAADLRPRLIGTSFEGDTSFDNRTTGSPWGQFTLNTTSSTRVRQNGSIITTSGGTFHIQPDTFPGCRGTATGNLADLGLCIDDSSLDRDLRFNDDFEKSIVSDRDRLNFFAFMNRDLDNGVRHYSELGFYYAETDPINSSTSPLGSGDIVIPANYYYNPFGPVTFSDGSINPNRLPGLTGVPDEGLPVFVDGGRFRLADVGTRNVNVVNTSFRALTGFKGTFGESNWDWDTALLWNHATTDDTTSNRVSSSLFQQALFNETPNVYNIFNGGNIDNPSFGDAPGNAQSLIDPFLISVELLTTSSLLLADFKASNNSIFSLPGGDIGLATGGEIRRESYDEDRDPRLDGTITFTDAVTGNVADSDVMNSTGTPDSDGSRVVLAAFAEAFVPLVSPEMNIPLINTLDLQLAARYEDYSDFGSSGVKPRIAVAWKPVEALKIRGAWSKGFRAPNLLVINQAVGRSNFREDAVFCQAGAENGTFADFGDCDGFGRSTLERREVAEGIGPEEATNTTFGMVFEPRGISGNLSFLNNLTVTADAWEIERENVVGVFGATNQINLDLVQRLAGSSNPNVVRLAPNEDDIAYLAGTSFEANPFGPIDFTLDTYDNNESQTVKGIDYAVYYDLDDTRFGDFGFKFNATQMTDYFIGLSPGSILIRDAVSAGIISDDISISQEGDIVGINGQPEWQANVGVTWRHANGFGAGARYTYVGDFIDEGPGLDPDGNPFVVEDYGTTNFYAEYRVSADGLLDDARFRIGVNNAFDVEPPLADETFGYFSEYHSSRGRYVYLDISKNF
jgi:outer membrane receptor protein involved in Fe transport